MTNRYIEITDLTDDDHFIIDTKANKKITYEDSIKLMNKLSDENEQFKKENELVDGIIRQNTHLQNDLNNAREHIQLLKEENEQLKQKISELQYSKKMLRANNKSLELGIVNLRKSFDNFDKMRVEHIRFLQKRMQKHGISIYYNDDDGDVE